MATGKIFSALPPDCDCPMQVSSRSVYRQLDSGQSPQ
jgi:hypothetical protein